MQQSGIVTEGVRGNDVTQSFSCNAITEPSAATGDQQSHVFDAPPLPSLRYGISPTGGEVFDASPPQPLPPRGRWHDAAKRNRDGGGARE
jgi:hypothetical protein